VISTVGQLRTLLNRARQQAKIRPRGSSLAERTLATIRTDPGETMKLAGLGLNSDPWQESFLRSTSERSLVLTSRQSHDRQQGRPGARLG